MAEVDVAPRSRRAVLAAALGAVAASVASAIGRPREAAATDNTPLIVGQNNAATKDTVLNTSAVLGLTVFSTGTTIQGIGTTRGVNGQGNGVDGLGVSGLAASSTGRGMGVYGDSRASLGMGVFGISYNNSIGVGGVSGPGTFAGVPVNERPTKTGVFGYAAQDALSRGVLGRSTVGVGVFGIATSGRGVYGTTFNGDGVRGETTTGVAVRAIAPTGGTALNVEGRAVFSRSGRATIPANATYVDVVVPGGLAPTTLVVATLEDYRTGAWVVAARKNYPVAGTVRIRLNKVASTSVSTIVGWIAIN